MAFPSEKDMEIPVLQEIAKAGGRVKRADHAFYQRVASYFPQLTPGELNIKLKRGENKWENKVQFVFRRLIKDKGELEILARGIVSITNKGKHRLEGTKTEAPSKETRKTVDELATEIKDLVEKLTELATMGKQETSPLNHDEMVQRIKEMGDMLGKVIEPVTGAPYKHDSVWRDHPYANPKLVWEVCDKGILDKDIASLIWAVKNWGAKSILVLFEESDFHTAQNKLAQERQIYPLKAEDALKLHSLLQAGYAQAIKAVFTI